MMPNSPYVHNVYVFNIFNFHIPDVTDAANVTISVLLVKHEHCFATHKSGGGYISAPFRIVSNQMQTTDSASFQTNYIQNRDKHNALFKDLEKHDIGSPPHKKLNHGTTYVNPSLIIFKGDSLKCVLDARHLSSITQQSDESRHIEPIVSKLARSNYVNVNIQ